MKTIFKFILPVIVFTMASAGAVSTKMTKDSKAKAGSTTEWIQTPDAAHCTARIVNCTTVNNGNFCMADSDTKQVFRKAGGQCNVLLYKLD